MRYLAQVNPETALNSETSKPAFLLMAVQESDDLWTVIRDQMVLESDRAANHPAHAWVLVQTNDRNEVIQVEDAKPWILNLVQTYLSLGITPEFLQQETERAEQWRQSLTLQNQELDRRALELEARREQLQALEADIKREKQELEPSDEIS